MLSVDMPLHNNAFPADVNGDSMLSPVDLLIVVNALNDPTTVDNANTFVDVNHDQTLSLDDYYAELAAFETPPVHTPPESVSAAATGYSGPSGPSGPTGSVEPPMPTITINTAPSDVNEADLFTISGTSTDAVTVHVESSPHWYPWSEAWDSLTGDWSFTLIALDDKGSGTPADTHTVKVIATNGSNTANAPFTLTIHDVAPTIANISSATVDEGSEAEIELTFTDALPAYINGMSSPHLIDGDQYTVEIDWGDGTVETISDIPWWSGTLISDTTMPGQTSITQTLRHTFLDDNPTNTPQDNYTVTITVTDDDTLSDAQTAIVTVKNVLPTIAYSHDGIRQLHLDELFDPGTGDITVTLAGTFVDVGVLDTHRVELQWADDIVTSIDLDPGVFAYVFTRVLPDSANLANELDVYPVKLTIKDDDTGTLTTSAGSLGVCPVPLPSAVGIVTATPVATSNFDAPPEEGNAGPVPDYAAEIAPLIVDLDATEFATRERASGKLVDIGKRDPAAFDAIAVAWEYRVANGFESPEVKYGLNKVLNDLAVAYAAYFRRQEVSGASTTDFACPVNILRLRRELPALITDAFSAARNAMSARVDAKLSTATARSRVKTEIDATTVFADPVEYRNKILLGVHKGLATPNVGEIRTLVLTIRKTPTFEQLRFVVHKMGEPAAIYEQGIVSP